LNQDDLHGNAPDTSPVALVLIDMINDLEFEGGDLLVEPAVEAARAIAGLKERARSLGIPVVYTNDNFGRWRSDFREVVEHCLRDGVRGEPVARLLAPEADDYFVLKPKHSAFFATTFETLLEYLGTRRLILTGVATDICVAFTAIDAYMRDFEVYVPADCVAALTELDGEEALTYLRRVCAIDTTSASELDLRALLASEGDGTEA
jgi:nicotinamidase-related amidase